MNIAFFSSSSHALSILEQLQKKFSVKLVVTSADKPQGRKQEVTPSPLKTWAEKKGIACLTPKSLTKNFRATDVEVGNPKIMVSEIIKELKIDLAIIMDFGLLIPKIVFTSPKLRTINIHFSLLPKYRGPYPDAFVLLNGEVKTGISFVLIDEGFDTGDIIARKEVEILPNENAGQLHQRCYQETEKILSYIINSWADYKLGKISKQKSINTEQATIFLPPLKQNHQLSNYTKLLGREDGYLSWQTLVKILQDKEFSKDELPVLIKEHVKGLPAISNFKFQILNLWRALSPWPGIWTLVRVNNEEKRLKLIQCHLEGEKFVIDQVQLEGKNPVSWKQFVEAYKIIT